MDRPQFLVALVPFIGETSSVGGGESRDRIGRVRGVTAAVDVVREDVVAEVHVGIPILVVGEVEGCHAVVLVVPEVFVGVGVGRILFDADASDQSEHQ